MRYSAVVHQERPSLRRALGLLVAFFIFANSSVPRIDFGSVDYGSVCTAIEQQAEVLFCASATLLPIIIINKYLEQFGGLGTGSGTDTGSRRGEQSQQPAPVAYIPSQTEFKKAGSTKSSFQAVGTSSCLTIPGLTIACILLSSVPLIQSVAGFAAFIISLLLCALRARGSIDDHSSTIISIFKDPTRHYSGSGPSLFGGLQ